MWLPLESQKLDHNSAETKKNQIHLQTVKLKLYTSPQANLKESVHES